LILASRNLVHGPSARAALVLFSVLVTYVGFAFLKVGTVLQKNQVNALSKILSDFAISTLAYFFIGYWISYGATFMQLAACSVLITAAEVEMT
jgi:Amt family ammonium transporter